MEWASAIAIGSSKVAAVAEQRLANSRAVVKSPVRRWNMFSGPSSCTWSSASPRASAIVQASLQGHARRFAVRRA